MREIIISCNLDAGEITPKRLQDFNLKIAEILQETPLTPENFKDYGNVDINLLNHLIQIKVTLFEEGEVEPSKIFGGVLEALESIYIDKIFGLSLTYNEDIEKNFNVFETDYQNEFRNVEEGIIGAGIKYAITKNGHNFDVVFEPSYSEYDQGVFNKYYFQVNTGFNTDGMNHKSIVKELNKLYMLSLNLKESSQEIFRRVDHNDDNL